MSINSKQFKGIAKKFGRSVDEVRELATIAGITSVSELTAHLESLATAAAPDPEPEADAVADAPGGIEEVRAEKAAIEARSGRGRKAENPMPDWYVAMGGTQSNWNWWHGFFNGSGPESLRAVAPNCELDQPSIIRVWTEGGRGMNFKRFCAELQKRSKATQQVA